MVDIRTLTQFSTGARYAPVLQSWVGEYDAQRLAAYQVWEDLYWTQVGITTAEASSDDAIQMPVAKSLVEAIVRYLAVDWDLYIDPAYGTPQSRLLADQTLRRLFEREDMWAKFSAQKRWGLVKGDAIWHVTGDASKAAGSRISIHTLDPASYFPILDPDNDDRVVGVHIADPVTLDGATVIRRQTYRRVVDDSGAVTVTSSFGYYDPSSWDDRDAPLTKPAIKIVEKEFVLDGITQLPVYRVPFSSGTGDLFGSSILRGVERILRGVDQTVTDEDLAVALGGLGVWVTDSAPPVDEDGNETDWQINPLNVVQLGKNADGKAATMQREGELASIGPSQDHLKYLENGVNRGASVPSIALGDVDTTVAESGIALFLRLSPLLAANAERETVLLGRIGQMLYDLVQDWIPTFEDIDFTDVVVSSVVGDPMPTNRDAKIAEIVTLATSTPPLITLTMAQAELAKLGYTFTVADGPDAVLAQLARQAAAVDPYAFRMADEAQVTTYTAVTPEAGPVTAPVTTSGATVGA